MRSYFQWQAPAHVAIDQSFSSYVDGVHTRWTVAFVARCTGCGLATEARQTRADALDDLDAAHAGALFVCEAAVADAGDQLRERMGTWPALVGGSP